LPCDLPQNGIFAEKFTKNGCLGRRNFHRSQLELGYCNLIMISQIRMSTGEAF